MAKVVSIKKKSLTNGQHFAFMKAFGTFLTGIELDVPKFKTTVVEFNAAFEQEDKCMNIARGSVLTQQIQEQDKIRDRTYGGFKRIVTAWSEMELEPQTSKATELLRLIKLYNINPQAQMDEETGLMDNLIGDVRGSASMSSAVDSLGLRLLFETMASANESVERLLAGRSEESAGKVTGALRAARLATDGLYDRLVEMLGALDMFVEDVSAIEVQMGEWNATVERYRTMLARKSTKDTPEEEGV